MFYSQQISVCIFKWSYKNSFYSEALYFYTLCEVSLHWSYMQFKSKADAMLAKIRYNNFSIFALLEDVENIKQGDPA